MRHFLKVSYYSYLVSIPKEVRNGLCSYSSHRRNYQKGYITRGMDCGSPCETIIECLEKGTNLAALNSPDIDILAPGS